MTGHIIIGIDPGVNTGFAELDTQTGKLRDVQSMAIHLAMGAVEGTHRSGALKMVVFEDARLRTWFGSKGPEARQGAGSIKRDCSIWADFLADLGSPTLALKPQAGMTKWSAAAFANMTGWTGKTNEHGRDAACLIWGRK